MTTSSAKQRWIGAGLWLLAVLLMLGAATYQRRTGPTYPQRGELVVGEESVRYRLLRSEETVRDARIAIPDPGGKVTGQLFFRRFKTGEAYRQLALERESRDGAPELAAYLPAQPAAGKLEYYLVLETAAGEHRIPAAATAEPGAEEAPSTVVLRFKDPVSTPLLLAHVLIMFLAMLIGTRAGLGALLAPRGLRRLAWLALAGMSVGGMILGPLVQKQAFGEYWTGFPWGYDLTDNKTLIMWLAWLVACAVVGLRARPRPRAAHRRRAARLAVAAAALVMMAVYLIPHSLRGSELDYDLVDQGVDPSQAVGTGD